MVFIGGDPTPAVKVLGRMPGEPVPLPEGLRAEWGPKGPVRKKP
jgi:hypothetical protein